MNTYEVTVTVSYIYEVEVDTAEEAERMGEYYEDYKYTAGIEGIEVAHLHGECSECGSEVEEESDENTLCDECAGDSAA